MMKQAPKPVILLIIDTLMSTPLEEAVQTGYAPALQYLMEKGKYFPHVVSSFPTMSVTIESTLLTGEYADKHRLPALIWYDEDEKRVINYGTGIKEVVKTGFSPFIKDMYYNLNNVHLSQQVKTIHEELAEKGLDSASINAFVYRGNSQKQIQLPRMLQMLTDYDDPWEIRTSTLWSLGSFSKFSSKTKTPQLFSGNYKAGFHELRYLIKKRCLPSFTFCVIQDLDLRVHEKGPMDLNGIKKVDRKLQKVLGLFSSWDHALEKCTWIVMSDNGHASMGKKRRQYVIDLRKLLKGFKIKKDKVGVQPKDEIVLCVNQRTAFVYCVGDQIIKNNVVQRLKQDKRIDLIAWQEGEQTHVVSGEKEGELLFSCGGEYLDLYQQSWTISGNEHLLDITISDKQLHYGDFPDALARLSSSLKSHKGNYLVITAKPGYEFRSEASPIHNGGAAHGSLHKQESFVPMIVTGTNNYPEHERIVDFKPWILSLLQAGHT